MIPVDKKITLEERDDLIIYIDQHIDDLSFNDKKEILTVLKNNIEEEKFKNKGTGTQLQYKHISNDMLIWIYNKIYNKITM